VQKKFWRDRKKAPNVVGSRYLSPTNARHKRPSG